MQVLASCLIDRLYYKKDKCWKKEWKIVEIYSQCEMNFPFVTGK